MGGGISPTSQILCKRVQQRETLKVRKGWVPLSGPTSVFRTLKHSQPQNNWERWRTSQREAGNKCSWAVPGWAWALLGALPQPSNYWVTAEWAASHCRDHPHSLRGLGSSCQRKESPSDAGISNEWANKFETIKFSIKMTLSQGAFTRSAKNWCWRLLFKYDPEERWP